jgi:hypothetical protein
MNPTDPWRPRTADLMAADRTEDEARARWRQTPEYAEPMRQG